MYRLYNPYTGEHLYTASEAERDSLSSIGWNYEGVGWRAPKKSSTPVYRLYNPYVSGGDHHYTTSKAEYDACAAAGWRKEGVAWYSDDDKGNPLYRQYNPYAETGTHNYTASKNENDSLVKLGWRAEGVAWYGLEKRWVVDFAAWDEPVYEEQPVYGTQWVQDSAAWDEPVYETHVRVVCRCGAVFSNSGDWGDHDYFDHNGEYSYHLEEYSTQTGTTHHDATGHYETVQTGTKTVQTGTVHHDEVGHWE